MASFLIYIFLTAMVLSLIIVFIKRGYTRANLFLGGYFFFCSFTNLVVNFGLYGDSPFWTALLGTNFWPVIFLIGPFAFFYVRSILTDDPKIKGYDYFHFTLFLLQLAGMIPYYLSSW
jgi:hypothetical protein